MDLLTHSDAAGAAREGGPTLHHNAGAHDIMCIMRYEPQDAAKMSCPGRRRASHNTCTLCLMVRQRPHPDGHVVRGLCRCLTIYPRAHGTTQLTGSGLTLRAVRRDRRPAPGCVDQRHYPDDTGFFIQLIHKPVMFMRYQLPRAHYFSRRAHQRLLCQPGRCLTEPLIHFRCSQRVSFGKVIPYRCTVIKRFRRPAHPHTLPAALVRRAANNFSTSSLSTPSPDRMDCRPLSTFCAR